MILIFYYYPFSHYLARDWALLEMSERAKKGTAEE